MSLSPHYLYLTPIFNIYNIVFNLNAQYDLNCVKSVKPKSTNQPRALLKSTMFYLSGILAYPHGPG